MFEKFGEFDSFEEINRAAAAQLQEDDEEAVKVIAEENGIDTEDAEDYIDGMVEELCTPLSAALGKLRMECRELDIAGVLEDWVETVMMMCMQDQQMCVSVRKKGKELKQLISQLIAFSFANKVKVSAQIVGITKVVQNGKTEALRGPLYIGVPNKAVVRDMATKYYLGGDDDESI